MHKDGHLPQLDGLRGLAILLVLLTHLFEWPVFKGAFHFGWVGVDLFFVLSGFLITRILLDSKGKPGAYRVFLIRRALRIFPLHYGVLLLIVLYCLKVNIPSYFLNNQFWYWTYTSNILVALNSWGPGVIHVEHFWSLAIEEQFYVVWPLIVLFLPSRFLIPILVGAILFSVLFRILYTGPTLLFHFTFTLSRLDALSLGSLLSVLLYLKYDILKYARPFFIVSSLAFISFMGYVWVPMVKEAIVQKAGFIIIGLFFTSLLLMTLVNKTAISVFSSRAFMTLGKYSYGIYVFHYIFAQVAQAELGILHGPQLTLIVLPATAIASYCSYHLYEKHFLKMKPILKLKSPA